MRQCSARIMSDVCFRSCIFDSSTNVFTTGQLTAALMEHIQKVTLEMKAAESANTVETQSF